MKEKLKHAQPVAYKILENSLLSGRMAHAFLFFGEAGSGKLKTAIWLAQCLLCEQDEFACGTCEICRRVENKQYTDLIVVDGSVQSIKKEDILHIQEEFTKTATEASGKKIYILNLVENATLDALNSLLKFLEEPVQDVIAILITQQVDRILPTIVSRCQRIPFKKVSVEEAMNEAKKNDLNPLDAYLCSHLCASVDEVVSLSENENYQVARILSEKLINIFYEDPYQCILEIQREGFLEKKGNDRIQFIQFVNILMVFFQDVIQNKTICEDENWKNKMNCYSREKSIQYLRILMENKDRCSKSASVKLLADSMMIQMKEVM